MTSDKLTKNKVVPQSNVKCRKCRSCNETLVHVLGLCIFTKAQIIRRHDEIRDFVKKKLATMKEGTKIIEEVFIPTLTCNLKPDLVVVIAGKCPRHRRKSATRILIAWMNDIRAK